MSEVYETIKRGLEDAVNGRVTEHMVEYAPVVRCKDCRHYNAGFECLIEGYGIERNPDWFCADGKARQDIIPDRV